MTRIVIDENGVYDLTPGWYILVTKVQMLDRSEFWDEVYCAIQHEQDAHLKANRRAEALRSYLPDVLHTYWELRTHDIGEKK